MIVIDMDIPKDCAECPIHVDAYNKVYCGITHKCAGMAVACYERMKECPIKCNIEDIKQEILDKDLLKYERVGNIVDIRKTRDYILGVIDKHTKGDDTNA